MPETVVVGAVVVVVPPPLLGEPSLLDAAAVAGKTAVITPESALFVAVAPDTVKKFAATPVVV